MSKPAVTAPLRPVAGLHATAKAIEAAIAVGGRIAATGHFPLSLEGLDTLVDWLEQQGVTKAALLQGNLAWPWQYERARRPRSTGPLDLAGWIEYQGEDALSRVDREAAWQPVMLALRNQFAVFLIRSAINDGGYPVPINREAAQNLALMLADGAFLAEFPKLALHRLIDEMSHSDGALREAVDFFVSETRGYWHNRARAKIARHLKHCDLDPRTREMIVRTIASRLVEGNFTEQFGDQLRLMVLLDLAASATAADQALRSTKAHVRRYGAWLSARLAQGGSLTSKKVGSPPHH